jgi:hypothetical protein
LLVSFVLRQRENNSVCTFVDEQILRLQVSMLKITYKRQTTNKQQTTNNNKQTTYQMTVSMTMRNSTECLIGKRLNVFGWNSSISVCARVRKQMENNKKTTGKQREKEQISLCHILLQIVLQKLKHQLQFGGRCFDIQQRDNVGMFEFLQIGNFANCTIVVCLLFCFVVFVWFVVVDVMSFEMQQSTARFKGKAHNFKTNKQTNKQTNVTYVAGIPSSGFSRRIFLMAQISPVSFLTAFHTIPYVPSPSFTSFLYLRFIWQKQKTARALCFQL